MGREGAPRREEAALRVSRRGPRHSKPSVPAWDQAEPSLPWWETVSQAPRQSAAETAIQGSEDSQITSVSPDGETGAGERGWTPMKRILLALGTLAALFAVAGATAKW